MTTKLIGILALATDHAIEDELRIVMGRENFQLFFNRVPASDKFNFESLKEIAGHLQVGSSELLPKTKLDVIVYGCTSGTIAAGEDKIGAILSAVRPNTFNTNPFTAGRLAMHNLRCHRIALLTPYPEGVHSQVLAALTPHFDVVWNRWLGIDSDKEISDVQFAKLKSIITQDLPDDADGIFISCTSLRIVQQISELESLVERPIVTSNQALAWHIAQLTGQANSQRKGHGKLMQS